MAPINTDNIIARATADMARATDTGFFADFSTDFFTGPSSRGSFDEHLRQAFETDASAAISTRQRGDTSSKGRNTDGPERVRREQHDRDKDHSGTADTVAGRHDDTTTENTRAADRAEPQDNRQDSQDSSTPSWSETATPADANNRTDTGRAQEDNASGTQTVQTQAPLDGGELVEQLIAENVKHNQPADMVTQHYADQQLSNAGSEQSIKVVENAPGVAAALQATVNQTNAAQAAQAQTDAAGESGKTVELPIEPQSQNTAEQTQNSEHNLDVELADATADKTAEAGKDTSVEEVRQQAAAAANTTEETFSQDTSEQSQVADGETLRQKNRRGSDRIEANAAADEAAEKIADADAQAAAASPLADTTVDNKIKSAQNAVDKINATDAGEKNAGDAKTTSSQPAQHDLSLPQRTQNAQETRAAAASGAGGVEDIDTVDRVRFVQRVARAVAGAGRDGGTLRIRLHPSELGSLRLEVTIRDGAMIARLETETQAAKNILLDSLPALRDRLAQQDIKVQQFDIDYAGGNNNGSAQNEAGQHQAHDRSADQPAASRAANEAETANEETQAVRRPKRLGGDAQLDFVA